jgi:hypothetical protein
MNYERTKVKDEKIEGHVVEFKVDGEGQWYASTAILHGEVWGKTIIEARAKITARLRRATVKLAIKAHLVNVLPESELDKPWHSRNDAAKANMLRPITLLGISQRGGDVMYQFDDSGAKSKRSCAGSQSRRDPDSIGVVCRRLTPSGEKEYRQLRDSFDAAHYALGAWIDANKIGNVKDFLESEIAAAIDKEPEVEDVSAVAPLRDSRSDGARAKELRRLNRK